MSWYHPTLEEDAIFAEEQLHLAASELIFEALERTGHGADLIVAAKATGIRQASLRRLRRERLTVRDLAHILHALGFTARLELSGTQ